jgi:hypothetical protein
VHLVEVAAGGSWGLARAAVNLPAAGIDGPGPFNFQGWFRDAAAGGATLHTSDALSITFVP